MEFKYLFWNNIVFFSFFIANKSDFSKNSWMQTDDMDCEQKTHKNWLSLLYAANRQLKNKNLLELLVFSGLFHFCLTLFHCFVFASFSSSTVLIFNERQRQAKVFLFLLKKRKTNHYLININVTVTSEYMHFKFILFNKIKANKSYAKQQQQQQYT